MYWKTRTVAKWTIYYVSALLPERVRRSNCSWQTSGVKRQLWSWQRLTSLERSLANLWTTIQCLSCAGGYYAEVWRLQCRGISRSYSLGTVKQSQLDVKIEVRLRGHGSTATSTSQGLLDVLLLSRGTFFHRRSESLAYACCFLDFHRGSSESKLGSVA